MKVRCEDCTRMVPEEDYDIIVGRCKQCSRDRAMIDAMANDAGKADVRDRARNDRDAQHERERT